MLAQLASVVSYLAIAGIAFEAIPTAAAVSHGNRVLERHPRDRHIKHMTNRQRVSQAIGARERRPRNRSGKVIRRDDGTECRVRQSASSAVTTTSSSTPAYVAATTATTTPAAASATPSSYDDSAQQYSSADASAAAAAAAVATTSSTEDTYYSATTTSSSVDWANDYATSSADAVTTTSSYVAPAASSAAATTSSSSGGKLGAAWPNGNYASSTDANYIGNYIGTKTSWYYTWSGWNVASGDSLGLEFAPMLWGPDLVDDFTNAQASWPSNIKSVLFFNEPNESSQSNIAAADSVSYWMNYMVPLRADKGFTLGTAATTSAPDGITWVTDLYSSCVADGNSASDCKADFAPVHYYDVTVSGFQTYLANFNSVSGLDLWVTEYACENFNGGAQCTSDETWAFHEQMAAWMDTQDYITRYSPFGMMENMQGVNQDNALMNPDGSITSLGTWYIYSS